MFPTQPQVASSGHCTGWQNDRPSRHTQLSQPSDVHASPSLYDVPLWIHATPEPTKHTRKRFIPPVWTLQCRGWPRGPKAVRLKQIFFSAARLACFATFLLFGGIQHRSFGPLQLAYCLEVSSLSKSKLLSLDFTANYVLIKLFKTSNIHCEPKKTHQNVFIISSTKPRRFW